MLHLLLLPLYWRFMRSEDIERKDSLIYQNVLLCLPVLYPLFSAELPVIHLSEQGYEN
jgi:hypothetical protein